MTLLSISNLSISFRAHTVVKDVSFSIARGEMFALVGESGSGKSLTALSIPLLLPESARVSGSVKLNDQEVIGATPGRLRELRGKDVGIIFQEPLSSLNPLHTIGRQIAEAIRGTEKQSRVAELLELVGLPHFKCRLDAWPHQLSGGERQRVMIAMAIANNPTLLIADEPTTAVDVTVQAKILHTLKDLQQRLGMSMLFITHDLGLVKKLADRVGVMQAGELVEIGTTTEIFSAPKHAYTKMLIGSAPKGGAVPLPGSAPLLGCENLSVKFPIKRGVFRRTVGHKVAVENATLSLAKGETLGIVGESGSGKTTLANALLRLTPFEGKIVYVGREISKEQGGSLLPLRREMQIVFQDPFGSLNPRMSVEEIVAEGLLVHEPKLSHAGRAARVEEALKQVGLPVETKHRYPHEFSGGQRQRIAIARAVVLEPKLIVLDEPTSALDLTLQSQILDLLKKLQTEQQLSYLFISHDLRVIAAIAHRIAVMKDGKIVETGETNALMKSPKEAYTKALLDAAFL